MFSIERKKNVIMLEHCDHKETNKISPFCAHTLQGPRCFFESDRERLHTCSLRPSSSLTSGFCSIVCLIYFAQKTFGLRWYNLWKTYQITKHQAKKKIKKTSPLGQSRPREGSKRKCAKISRSHSKQPGKICSGTTFHSHSLNQPVVIRNWPNGNVRLGC